MEQDIDKLIEQFNEAREYAALCRSRQAQAEAATEYAEDDVKAKGKALAEALK